AGIAGGAGPGISDLDARPDVLAGGRPPDDIAAGNTAAHHTLADTRHTRRRALARDRHTRRRSTGAVDARGLPAPCAPPHEPAAGDRCADVHVEARCAIIPSASIRTGPSG